MSKILNDLEKGEWGRCVHISIIKKISIKLFIGILLASVLIGILAVVPQNVRAEIGDVVNSFSAPEGTWPSGLAWDGSNLWMSSNAIDYLYVKEIGIFKLDPMKGTVLYNCKPAKYNNYSGLTYDGTYLLNADAYGSGIYKLNTSDCSIVSIIKSPDKFLTDLAWDGRYLWLYGYPSQKIYKVRPADGLVVKSYDLPGEGKINVGLTYDGAHLWLSGTDDMIYNLDPSDLSVISSFPAPCSRPDSLAWDGKYLWCACASSDEGMIYQIDIGLTAPLAPQNLQVTSNDNYIKLRWDVPSNDGGSPILRYNIYRDTTYEGERTQLTTIGNILIYIDDNVTNDQKYYYQVSAGNSAGEGEKSDKVIIITAPASETTAPTSDVTPPSAPVRLETDEGDGYVELKWGAPDNDGGSSILRYWIYRSTTYGANKTLLVIVVNELTYTDSDVTNDQTYYYQVSAENSAGEGEKSYQENAKPTKKPINWVNIATLIAAIVTISATLISYFNSRKSISKEKN